ncbi:MAG: prephenate dehydrogenase/arogenate dehydrogenase family protein [Planctomycetales bacterium]
MSQTRWNNAVVIGVGLIGGSIGLALLRRNLADRVTGVGRRRESLEAAAEVGAVTEWTLDLAEGVSEADLIIVCSPVSLIPEHAKAAAVACPEGTLITDAGSTKGRLVEQHYGDLGRGVRFLGSHPMAGSEKSGPRFASADLFEDRATILTPTEDSLDADVKTLTDFWTSLGARVVELSPSRHDEMLAFASHLPHLIAVAAAAAIPVESQPYSAGGFRDVTRIAAGKPDLWRQIFLENRDAVLTALDAFDHSLDALRGALRDGDPDALLDLLSQAKRNRDALGS